MLCELHSSLSKLQKKKNKQARTVTKSLMLNESLSKPTSLLSPVFITIQKQLFPTKSSKAKLSTTLSSPT